MNEIQLIEHLDCFCKEMLINVLRNANILELSFVEMRDNFKVLMALSIVL